MLKHLCKLVWNRKRSSFLMITEIFFSFLVLFAVMTLAAFYLDNYHQPLGYSYENVWHVDIDMNQASDDYWSPEQVTLVNQLLLAVRECEEVENVAGAHSAPYDFGGRSSGMEVRGKRFETRVNEVTDEFKEVMELQLVSGRWFEKADEALNWQPVVINQKLARELFGEEEAAGKPFTPWAATDSDVRVIGVVTDFRQTGEYMRSQHYLFERKKLGDPQHRPPRHLLVKVRPGTTAEFEEKLDKRLQAVARDWSFDIEPLAQKRQSALKLLLAPLIAAGLVAGFLMIMVGLGLVGVLWQNVTQRTKELGLRRAKGAAAGDILKQILGELLLLTTLGVAAGVILVAQIPLLDLAGFINSKVYVFGLAAAIMIIYGLTLAAGLYPSWLATRVQPAEALRYE